MFKRIFLFLATNIAIMLVLSIVIMIIEKVFLIDVVWYAGWNYIWLLIFALIFWFWWAFISLFMSKWIAKKAYKIKIISVSDYYNLNSKQKIVFDVIKDLSERKKITMPEVWIYNSQEPNAFATWAFKNSSLVAVSSWLLELMDKDAIEWVIGHEMAHVLNGDMVTMTLLQWVLNTFVIFISRILAWIVDNFLNWERNSNSGYSWSYYLISNLFQIIFWILASLITMWFSRHREFRADAWSAEFVWKQKMIAWLEVLKNLQNFASGDDSKLAAFKISTKWRKWFLSLLSTHPDLDDRINALKELNI